MEKYLSDATSITTKGGATSPAIPLKPSDFPPGKPEPVTIDLRPTGDTRRIKKESKNIMTYYYVDIENMHYEFVKWFDAVDPKVSKFLLYYTNNVKLNDFEFVIDMMEAVDKGFRFECVRCNSGDQSLDKMLIADLAVHATRNPKRDYIVISRDNGYQQCIDRISELTHSNIILKPFP